MKKLLFVSACLNRDISRTTRLSSELISLLNRNNEYEVDELILEDENIQVLRSDVLNKCFALLEKGDFSNEFFRFANQFKEADLVVIATPYWNASFPAILKAYLEVISWPGITFEYGDNLKMLGKCKGEKLYYVTTRGGNVSDDKDLGFITVLEHGKGLGIKEIKCISVDSLDIDTNDAAVLVQNAINNLANMI